ETGALDVKDLAAQRQHSLIGAIAALRGGPAGTITLNEKEFGLGGILLRAVLELAGEEVDVERRFAARQFARLARRFAGRGSFCDLADDGTRLGRMFLKPLLELVVYDVFDSGADFG